MYTKRDIDVMLYCIVLGDPIERSILIKAGRDMSITELRDSIREKNNPFLKDVPANRLKLWQVNIPVDNLDLETKINAENIKNIEEQLVTKNRLHPMGTVGEYFKDDDAFSDQKPADYVIRIIIQPDYDYDYVTGQKRKAYPEPELEPKRQKTLTETLNFEDFVNKLSAEVTVVSPPELYPINKKGIAGRFHNPRSCIPISGKNFPDMRLNDKEITPMGEYLASLFENEKEKVCQILYAVSGAGKTRAIFDMAMHNKIFVTYIECMPAADESQGFVKMEPTADTNFGDLVARLKEINVRTDGEHDNIENAMNLFRVKATHFIAQDFTARLLYLVILKKNVEGLTPREYLLSQIDGGRQSIKLIKPYLKSFETNQLENIFTLALQYLETTLRTSLVFALDEANVAATKLFSSLFLNRNEHPRGLLTPMVEFLNNRSVSIVIAGTSFSLEQGKHIQSDIAKGVPDDYIVNFQPLTIEEVESYLKYYLNLSECNFKDIEEWKYLEGRPRLAARLVSEIIREEDISKGEKSKQDVLKAAVKQTLKAVRKRLTETLSNFVKEAYDGIDTHGWRTMLETLFINCWFFGGLSGNEFDERSRKLVDCGIASLKQGSNKLIEVTEPLAVEVVNTVLALNYNCPTEALINRILFELYQYVTAADFDKSNTAKGFAWQYLVLVRLIDFNGKTVYEFVNEICRDQSQLPDWTKDAKIEIKSYGSKRILSMLDNALEDVKDDVDVVQKLLWGLTSNNYLLVPSTSMRPDGLYIGKCNSWDVDSYWTLLLSAKLYSENLSGDKVEMDKRSTDLDLAYYEVNGKKVNCSKLKNKLDNVRNGFVHHGSLRIHFIYPGVASSRNQKDRGGCHLEGNDVIMYIDKTLLDRYFSVNYVNRLKKIFLNYKIKF